MDDEALRTHHVIAALLIGLGFAGFNVIASPFRRMRRGLFSLNFAAVHSAPDQNRRILRRMDEPST